MLNFLKSHQNCFPWQWNHITFLPTTSKCYFSSQHFFSFFLIFILVGRRWFVTVLLIYISLVTNDLKHLFMYLLAICISSLDKCLFKTFVHFLTRLFVFLLFSSKSSLHSLDTRPLSYI